MQEEAANAREDARVRIAGERDVPAPDEGERFGWGRRRERFEWLAFGYGGHGRLAPRQYMCGRSSAKEQD